MPVTGSHPIKLDVAMRNCAVLEETLASADQFMKRNYRKLERHAYEPYQKDGLWYVRITYNMKEATK